MRTWLLPFLLLFTAACGDSAGIQAKELLARLHAGSSDLPPDPWLAVDEDGSVWCSSGKLWWPGASSEGRVDPFLRGAPDEYWRLADWLTEVAAPAMPVEEREYWNADWPVRGGVLRIWVHPDASLTSLGEVQQGCLRPGTGIYRFELPLGAGAEPAQGMLILEGCRWGFPPKAEVHLRVRSGRNPLREEARSSLDRWCQLSFTVQRSEERRLPFQMEGFTAWLEELEAGTEVRVNCEPGIRFHQLVPVLERIRDRPGLQLCAIAQIPVARRSLLFED